MRVPVATVFVVLFLACNASTPSGEPSGEPAPRPSAAGAPASASGGPLRAALQLPGERCRQKIKRLRALPPLPGAPEFERQRARLLAGAKAAPVLLLRAPQAASGASAEVEYLRSELARFSNPAQGLRRVAKYFSHRPEVARAVLLRQGYLYADSPGLALALVERVRLRHLFREDELLLQRGGQTRRLVWDGKQYRYAEGPKRGKRARLLLLDRVWSPRTDPGPPLHVGLRSLARGSGADRVRVERLTAEGIVAELRYGSVWVPSVLVSRHAEAVLECEQIPRGAEQAVSRVRGFALRKQRVLSALRAAIDRQVREALPFDEPRTEVGQQDGSLRPAWRWAFESGLLSYRVNEERYQVYDPQGRPLLPQVCIDFITDTLERASGTWWPSRMAERHSFGVRRERTRGNLDFETLGIENRRSVDVFVDFAWNHPRWFDAYDLPAEERIAFFRRAKFFDYIYRNRERFLPGDIVTVHGPRDDEELHYHSFFIYDGDPITGMPTLLASNAGRPRIRTWEQELRSAPKRSIRSRIRPRLPWLESLVVLREEDLVANEQRRSETSG